MILPLQGVRIVEFEGLGPGPLAGLMLAEMGAEVTVIVRPGKGCAHPGTPEAEVEAFLRRGKQVRTLDLKAPHGVKEALELVAGADALIEGNRPGVMERLGLGPAECAAYNPRLVFGRVTGWGQSGPLSQAAGHDLNFVALSGLLALSARPGQAPIVPATVVGDGAGALGLAFGIASGVVWARSSGKGCVVDAAIVDVLAMMSSLMQKLRLRQDLDSDRSSVFYDSPFYDAYECADGNYVTVCAVEPQFYALLLKVLGVNDIDCATQFDRAKWADVKARFAAIFKNKPRSHWCELMEGTDACFAPVLSVAEAADHAHNRARGLFTTDKDGRVRTARGLNVSAI